MDTLCVSCGEEKATTWIPNPNSFEFSDPDAPLRWSVCETCEKFIDLSQRLAIAEVIGSGSMRILGPDAQARHEAHIEDLYRQLDELQKTSGKEMMIAKISRVSEGDEE